MRDPVPVAPLGLDDSPPVLPLELNDRPPDYSIVASEKGLTTTLHPQVPKSEKVETPPPDYTTISPFDKSSGLTETFV